MVDADERIVRLDVRAPDAVIEDATLGAEAEAMFLADLEMSAEITLRERGNPKLNS
mgnify:CR=1 FL=1